MKSVAAFLSVLFAGVSLMSIMSIPFCVPLAAVALWLANVGKDSDYPRIAKIGKVVAIASLVLFVSVLIYMVLLMVFVGFPMPI